MRVGWYCVLMALYFITSERCISCKELNAHLNTRSLKKKKRRGHTFGHVNAALEKTRSPYRLFKQPEMQGNLLLILLQQQYAVVFHAVMVDNKNNQVHHACAYCPFRSKYYNHYIFYLFVVVFNNHLIIYDCQVCCTRIIQVWLKL